MLNQNPNIAMLHTLSDEVVNEMEAGGDDQMGSCFIKQYEVLSGVLSPEDRYVHLQRYQGDGMKIIGNRIEVDRLDYAFIPGGTDHNLYDENELEEWAKDYKLDVRIIGYDEVTPDLATSEAEKTPLELLAQRTANEHEQAFGKMMEAMADMDYSKVQEALTSLKQSGNDSRKSAA